jgi:cell division protein FtsZ
MVAAEDGIEELKNKVDTLIVIPNQRILDVVDRKMTLVEAFRVVDGVLAQGVQGISDIITVPGLINRDFADVKAIMKDAGSALLGIGTGVGENRALTAAKAAISSPLLDVSIQGAKGILFNITGGPDLTMTEVDEAAKAISQEADADANIIFGATIIDSMVDQVKITVIATGFDEHRSKYLGYISPRYQPEGIVSESPSEEKTDDEESQPPPSQDENQPSDEFSDAFDIPAFLRHGKK